MGVGPEQVDEARARAGDPGGDPLLLEPLVHSLDASAQLIRSHLMIGVYVRRRTDDLDAVVLRLASHRHAVFDVDGAVVERGQDVAVEVDHRASSRTARAYRPIRRAPTGSAGSSTTKAVVPGKRWFCQRVAVPGYGVIRRSGRRASLAKRRSTESRPPERSTSAKG